MVMYLQPRQLSCSSSPSLRCTFVTFFFFPKLLLKTIILTLALLYLGLNGDVALHLAVYPTLLPLFASLRSSFPPSPLLSSHTCLVLVYVLPSFCSALPYTYLQLYTIAQHAR